ncbi:MAG: twin-arginine translocase TatA/TatE family subunit [Chloroflexi bacterium]|nr:twin-arginine translocase TatA/TatE family subunit [Chloroflexota bacterium]
MPHIGLLELIIILAVILLLFGATRLPQLARGLGKSVHEFKRGSSGEDETTEAPAAGKGQASAEKARGS